MARTSTANTQATLDRAQELMYEAWDAESPKRRIALAEKALSLSPLCADAYVLLAGHAKRGSDQELDLWRQGVDAGTKALGKARFDEYAGEFWGFPETRPYMRARLGLALALWARGFRMEAIHHLTDMLRLNPNDNQGARYILAGFLLEAARDKDLAVLLKQYQDDSAAAWSWTAALAAFRRGGDSKKSRALLVQALAGNKYVPAYLCGARRIPRSLPSYISPGRADEAIHYAADFRAGWINTPGAIDWLRAHAPTPPGKSKTA
jgi:tetratricopeptide (TPR) repeat protein